MPLSTPSGSGGAAAPPDPEQLLADASHLLSSGAGHRLEEILALLGTSLRARRASFSFASAAFIADDRSKTPEGVRPPPPVPSHLLGQTLFWSSDGSPPDDALSAAAVAESHLTDATSRLCLIDGTDGQHTIAIPLLSEDDQFVGHLGFEMDAQTAAMDGYARVLPVVGDVIGTHLSRMAAEEARQQTEERWHSLVDRHPDGILVTVGDRITYANETAATMLAARDADAVCQLSVRDLLPDAEVQTVYQRQAEQLANASPRPYEHTLVRLDGTECVVESVSVPFSGIDGAVQTVLRDITERVATEARYRTFVETISEGVWRIDLTVPLVVADGARGGLPPEVQAEHVLEHGRLAELNPAMRRMFWPKQTPIGNSVEALAGDAGFAFFRALAEANYRIHNHEIAVPSQGDGTWHVSVNAVGQFVKGALVSLWGSCTDITDRVNMERGMMEALEEQQERIGRDLHDSVGQLLTGVRMLSENLAARSAEPDVAQTAQRVSEYTAEALDRVRAICRGLVPPQLYSEGVAAALAELVEHVDALSPTRCFYVSDPSVDLFEPDVSLHFYRIAQEALGNTLKHAQAANVWVELKRVGTKVVMEVRDDGVGFVFDRNRPRSLGLFGMRRRAHLTGAAMTVQTRPGAGTTIRVSRDAGRAVPLRRPAADLSPALAPAGQAPAGQATVG